MDLRSFARAGTILLFLLLSMYFAQHPVFERFDISQYEGETIPIYFTNIADKSEDGYIIEIGIEKQRAEVITDANLKPGEIASLYGTVKNNRLIVQRHYRHKYPEMPYYLSFIGLIGFLWLMKREGS